MIEKLEAIKNKYDILTEKIADPEVIARMDEWKKIAKERADMEATLYTRYFPQTIKKRFGRRQRKN